jgi:hypothetical protein
MTGVKKFVLFKKNIVSKRHLFQTCFLKNFAAARKIQNSIKHLRKMMAVL